MIPVIIFDFGGVLLDWNPRYLYRKVFNGDEQAMESFLTEVDFYTWNLNQDQGRPFDEGIRIACAQHPQYCDLLQIYRDRWIETISGPIDGTVKILRELKQSGYRLFGLSNWSDETFYMTRDKFEFLNLFEQIIISGAVGLIKPDPAIFALLLDKVGRPPEQCLLIDDSPDNVTTARRLGFQTIHFESPVQLRQTLVTVGVLNA
jgi:2-haloacid dehalogenase